MKILVTGSSGQLGKCIQDALKNPLCYHKNEYIFLTHRDLDITDKRCIELYFKTYKDIGFVINCAAYTKVDAAEKNICEAFRINSLGVKNLVDVCEKYHVGLIHISTDYVYKDNTIGTNEDYTEIEPINIYGQSKRDGELHIINSNLKFWYIFRTSWLYSYYPGNFFTKIIEKYRTLSYGREEMKIVTDEIGTPTYALSLAELIICIIEHKYYLTTLKSGIYNTAGNGNISRYYFAENILYGAYNISIDGKIIAKQVNLVPIIQDDLNLPAKRPRCIIMNSDKLYSCIPILQEDWIYELQDCLNKYERLLNNENLFRTI